MKEQGLINVEMVGLDKPTATRTYNQTISSYARFGRELKISPKACVTVNKSGFKTEFFVESVNVLVGIGKDHTADVIMTKEAWEAFKNGEEISITTVNEFKENIL